MAASVDKFSFVGDEIIVSIPTSIVPKLIAVSREIGTVELHPASGFQPIRIVANIVIETQNNPGVALTDLGGTLTFRVKYRLADLQAAGSKPLVLAFWDGARWVPLTTAKHGFKLTAYANPADGGYATISISRWADPPISWGT
jgi:hypothetical protein